MYDLEDKKNYCENLLEQLRLEEEVWKDFRYKLNIAYSEAELDFLIKDLLQYLPDKIDSGFNYGMKEITKKINKIIK